MQLVCRSCKKDLHGRDVDFNALSASCRNCGWQLGSPTGSAYRAAAPKESNDVLVADKPPPRPMPPLPHYISIDEWGANDEHFLEVSIRPQRPWVLLVVIPLLLLELALIWHVDSVMATWLTPFFVIGFYAFAVKVANTTHLYVSEGSLVVSSSPVPWVRREIRASDLQQLWVSEVKDKNGNSTYRLCARTTNKVVILADTQDDPSGALHLERRIEEMLGIVDVPVPGEIDAAR